MTRIRGVVRQGRTGCLHHGNNQNCKPIRFTTGVTTEREKTSFMVSLDSCLLFQGMAKKGEKAGIPSSQCNGQKNLPCVCEGGGISGSSSTCGLAVKNGSEKEQAHPLHLWPPTSEGEKTEGEVPIKNTTQLLWGPPKRGWEPGQNLADCLFGL